MVRNEQRLFRYHTFLVFFLAGIFLLAHGGGGKERREETAPFGRYSAAQMRERSGPLCRLLAAPGAGLRLTAEERFGRAGDGESVRWWMVTATDEGERVAAVLVWDADTGALLQVTNGMSRTHPRGQVIRTPREAVQAAREWLEMLRVPGQVVSGPPARAPEQVRNSWYVTWRAQGRVMTVRVHADSGDLVTLRVKRDRGLGHGEAETVAAAR